jgi:hypothetical protein
MTLQTRLLTGVSIGLVSVVFGCSGRPSVLPNSDMDLRRSSAEFAADAAKRHPYKSDASRGGEAPAGAQVGYVLDRLEIVNLSDQNWSDVEVWVNQQYVVYVPSMEKGKLKVFNFQMIYDDHGKYLPTDSSKERVNKVELYCDGKMYDVRLQLAD